MDSTDTATRPDVDEAFDLALEHEERRAYTSGLRKFADLLDTHPDVPLPFSGREHSPLDWLLFDESNEDQKAAAAAIVRAIPGAITKSPYGTSYFQFEGSIDGLHLQVIVGRPAVCVRVVTGTETVTREVPDPVALAAVPTVTETETVETYRWDCAPLLAGETGASS